MKTDITSLGKLYTLTNKTGTMLVRVIEMDDLINHGIGPLDLDKHSLIGYLRESKKYFTGHVKESDISFYCASEEKFDMQDAFNLAFKEQSKILVIEKYKLTSN